MNPSHTSAAAGEFHGLSVRELLRTLDVPGCSVAVMDGGEIVEQHAFGVRSRLEPAPVTPQTVFQACSISKPVSVLGALRLVEAGDLDLDADVNELLIGWQVPANGGWQPRVTLRQLAGHTAGLTTSGFGGYPAGSLLPSLVQILSGVAPANSPGVRVETMPGLGFRYSGGGTTVIQMLLESVSGADVADLLEDLVLAPLGMAASTFAQPLPQELADRAALGHRIDGSPLPGGWHTYPEQCAAGLWTTPSDLLRFARGVQGAWRGDPGALLSPETAGQMLQPHASLPAGIERAGGLGHIGLGPFLRVHDGATTWFGHSGANEGYRCHVMASTRTGQGAAVMTNGDGGSGVVERLFEAIAVAYEWDDVEFRPTAPIARDRLDMSVGAYVTESGLPVELSNPDGVATITIGDQPAASLQATSAHELVAVDLSLTVGLDPENVITVKQDGQVTTCTRVTATRGRAHG